MKKFLFILMFLFIAVGVGIAQTKDQPMTATWVDNSSNELGFSLKRRNADGTFTEVQRVGVNVVTASIIVNGVEGQEFCFAVDAFNNNTDGVEQHSALSNTACAKIPISVPGAPGNFTIVTVDSTSSKLNWENPNNSPIRIFRTAMQGGGDTHEIILSSGSVSYLDNFNLRKNWTYCYSIQELGSEDVFGSGCIRMPNA